jgi:DnaK suppressor protein
MGSLSSWRGESTGAAEMIDQASSEETRFSEMRIREREGKLVGKIKKALQKIDDGTYGICEECGESISEKRLEVRPVATLCIECKREQELME